MKWMKMRATNGDKWGKKKWREKIMLNGNRIVQFYITAVGSDK